MAEDPVASLLARAGENNVTMAALCEKAKVAQSTPSRWANGADPKLGTIRKLDAALTAILRSRAA